MSCCDDDEDEEPVQMIAAMRSLKAKQDESKMDQAGWIYHRIYIYICVRIYLLLKHNV